MKTYICTKIIHAVPSKMVNGFPWAEGLPLPPVKTVIDPIDGEAKHRPAVEEGYLYVSDADDLYPQFMKTEDFEAMCRPVDSMSFGYALEAMKHGERVARAGWNGKDMYIFIASEPDFTTDADISALDNREVAVGDVICMKTAQDTFQLGWLASQADMLAEDWYIVE